MGTAFFIRSGGYVQNAKRSPGALSAVPCISYPLAAYGIPIDFLPLFLYNPAHCITAGTERRREWKSKE